MCLYSPPLKAKTIVQCVNGVKGGSVWPVPWAAGLSEGRRRPREGIAGSEALAARTGPSGCIQERARGLTFDFELRL